VSPNVAAVIVGERGWHPPPVQLPAPPGIPPRFGFALSFDGVHRFVWHGNEVAHDGQFDVRGQATSLGYTI
jgi:hypothetical protein